MTSKDVFNYWDNIQQSLNQLFFEKAKQNYTNISNFDLIHYSGEVFTWLRETHKIYQFDLDKLEEMNAYVEEHIFDILWYEKAKEVITKIFKNHPNMFTKEDRSTFKYWFAHWCAFNMTALNLKCWKFKYLFHDWYKPWLKLFISYEKLQKFHRYHSNHHLEYHYDGNKHYYNEIDWEALAIDWECSRFTKNACPRNAHQEAESKIKKHPELEFIFETYLFPVLRKLNIDIK